MKKENYQKTGQDSHEVEYTIDECIEAECAIDEYIDKLNESLYLTPNYSEGIGSRIKEALDKYNKITGFCINQEQLAKCMHVSPAKVSCMIAGVRPPKANQLINLSKILHVSADFILGLKPYSTDLYGFSEEQQITGLSQLSISNLVKYKNSKEDPFEMDLLFRNYHINFTVIVGNESRKDKEDWELPTRIPHLIFTSDYSRSIPDMPIEELDLPKQINYKLYACGINTIATLILLQEEILKDTASLDEDELKVIIDSTRQYLDAVFDEEKYSIKTGRALKQTYMSKYAGDLGFLNAILEDGVTFISLEENVSNLYYFESVVKTYHHIIEIYNDLLQEIKDKYHGGFEEYSKQDQEEYLNATEAIHYTKQIMQIYAGRIEYTRMNLFSSISKAIEKYIKEKMEENEPMASKTSVKKQSE